MLWHCWVGGRKGIRPVKNWLVGCWHGYVWSEVQICIWSNNLPPKPNFLIYLDTFRETPMFPSEQWKNENCLILPISRRELSHVLPKVTCEELHSHPSHRERTHLLHVLHSCTMLTADESSHDHGYATSTPQCHMLPMRIVRLDRIPLWGRAEVSSCCTASILATASAVLSTTAVSVSTRVVVNIDSQIPVSVFSAIFAQLLV